MQTGELKDFVELTGALLEQPAAFTRQLFLLSDDVKILPNRGVMSTCGACNIQTGSAIESMDSSAR